MMGPLDGLLGNASKVDPSKHESEYSQLLAGGERVEHAYQLIRARPSGHSEACADDIAVATGAKARFRAANPGECAGGSSDN